MGSKKHLLKILKIGLVVVLLAACPYTRNTFLYQGGMALGNMDQPRFIHSAPIPRLEQGHPKNLEEALVIAHYETGRNKSTDAYWKIIKKFPNEPALYANMLRYETRYSQFGRLHKRPETDMPSHKTPPKSWKPLPDTPESRKYEHTIKMGQKLEPDNIYFDLFEIALRFSQGRDDEALASLHKAAGKKQFNSHTWDETSAVINDACRRSHAPFFLRQFSRLLIHSAVIFPEYSRFRQSARMAAWYAGESAKRGQYDRSLAIMADLVKVGGIMRDDGETPTGVLVAESIQKMGVGEVYRAMFPRTDKFYKKPSTDLLAGIKSVAPLSLKPGEWQALHDNLARSIEFRRRFKSYSEHSYLYNGSWTKPFIANLSLMGIAGDLLFRLSALGLIWLTAFIWLQKRRTDAVIAGPSRLSIWLIAVLPTVAVSMLVIVMKTIYLFGMSHNELTFGLPMAIGLMLLTPVIVVVIAAERTRIAPEIGRFDTFLSRLRVGSAYAIQALVALYILTTIVLLPVVEKTRITTDRMVLPDKVQMIWEYQPPDSK